MQGAGLCEGALTFTVCASLNKWFVQGKSNQSLSRRLHGKRAALSPGTWRKSSRKGLAVSGGECQCQSPRASLPEKSPQVLENGRDGGKKTGSKEHAEMKDVSREAAVGASENVAADGGWRIRGGAVAASAAEHPNGSILCHYLLSGVLLPASHLPCIFSSAFQRGLLVPDQG